MSAKRDIFCEYKGESADKLEETKKKYYESIDKKGGAIFMAVLRGKVSEGVDFIDMYGRAVVIVGIPFAYNDTKIQSKKQYMDSKSRGSADKSVLSGSKWYCLDAIKAVNQAIGRVIRHKNDYGAILLCDIRYQSDINEHLSAWVRENPSTNTFVDFQTMTTRLKEFFARCERTVCCLTEFCLLCIYPMTFFWFSSFRNQNQSISQYQCDWISMMQKRTKCKMRMLMGNPVAIMRVRNPINNTLRI